MVMFDFASAGFYSTASLLFLIALVSHSTSTQFSSFANAGNTSPNVQTDKSLDSSDSPPNGLAELQRIEAAAQQIIPKVTPCIVSIGESASGVIVKSSGIIITASHVTRQAGRTVIVRLQDGRRVKGVTLGSNAANDTSAIQLNDPGPWPYLKTVDIDSKPIAGQWCIAFGYPLSWPRDQPSSGRLGRVTGQFKGKIVTDCPIMGGDSGGALVDLNGNLMAINSSVRLDVTENLHVPIARYREDWRTMMQRRDIDQQTAPVASIANRNGTAPAGPKKIYLGVYAESIPNAVRVRDVRRGSPAERFGVNPEDVIRQIDEAPIDSFASLVKFLAEKKSGDLIRLKINRFGRELEIDLTLEAR